VKPSLALWHASLASLNPILRLDFNNVCELTADCGVALVAATDGRVALCERQSGSCAVHRQQALPRVGHMTVPQNSLIHDAIPVVTRSVFHYTSSQGLIGILESKRLRASEASSLNDLAEIRQGWDSIRKWLKNQPKSDAVDLLSDFAADPMKGKHEVFVLSGSTEADDANQWRLYADGGTGYAIELDGSIQLAVVTDVPAAPNTPRYSYSRTFDITSITPWLHVLYSEPKIKAALEQLVAAVESKSRSIESDYDAKGREFHYEGLRDDSYEALATVAHLIKTPGFSGENEVRVVATFLWGDHHVCYRPGAHGIVGYATLTQAPNGYSSSVLRVSPDKPVASSLPVKSVRLGPLLGTEHENTVRAFLRRSDLTKADVTLSAVHLR
jgi:hypothetical protein